MQLENLTVPIDPTSSPDAFSSVGRVSPCRTAVSFWGQTSQSQGSLSPKRDCSTGRIKSPCALSHLLVDSLRGGSELFFLHRTEHPPPRVYGHTTTAMQEMEYIAPIAYTHTRARKIHLTLVPGRWSSKGKRGPQEVIMLLPQKYSSNNFVPKTAGAALKVKNTHPYQYNTQRHHGGGAGL